MNKSINPFISPSGSFHLFHDIFANHLVPFSLKKVKKDEIIFHPQSFHPYSYYVKSGLIKIAAFNQEGREKVLFFHQSGTIFGFQNMSSEKLTVTKASAVTDSELYQFEYDFFHEFLRNSPDYFSMFLAYIFNMMVLQAEDSIHLSFYSTNDRLAGLLVILHEEYNHEGKENTLLPYSNDDLASMLGVCRNSISHAMGVLQADQIIEKRRNGVIIKDFQKLKEYNSTVSVEA